MTATDPHEALAAIDRLFLRALIILAEAGAAQRHSACELAASAWSALRRIQPREAERFNGVLHRLTRTRHPQIPINEETTVSRPKLLDVRKLIPMERHRKIFDTYEKLKSGESFVLVNDHDPKPLYYQFEAEHSGQFSWNYLQQGPSVWQVEIGRTAAG
jgi:uncharacterized protein (DUF2249 family)